MSFFGTMDRRRVATALVALAIAFATGHVMQSYLVSESDMAIRGEAPATAPIVESGEAHPSLPAPPAATIVPFVPPEPITPNRLTDDPVLPLLPLEDASLVPFGAPCDATVRLSDLPFGMARLTVAMDTPASFATSSIVACFGVWLLILPNFWAI